MTISIQEKNKFRYKLKTAIRKDWGLYLLILLPIAYFIIFHYIPMYGIIIAFKDFSPMKGILGSDWAGLKHFERFFNSFYFWRLIKNTLGLSFYQLIVGFPIPIILALMMNEVRNKYFKKTVQMATYAPHFLSMVVVVGMVTSFLSLKTGIINNIIEAFGGERIYFMTEPQYFKTIYVLSGVWQNAGWKTIIYMAALAGIDVELYEAATVDGASKLQKLFRITIPSILPTIVILLILDVGRIMNIGFEKVFLLQNDLTLSTSEIISTYVYKIGLLEAQYSFAAAVGLFRSVVNFILLITVNSISKRISETSLW